MRARDLPVLTLGLLAILLIAVPVTAQNPKLSPDDTWLTLDGTVAEVGQDEFTLDYGTGFVTVEMDDADRDAENYRLAYGDRVRVTGRVDDDLFETRTIEAASVYVHRIEVNFYADPTDEETPLIRTNPDIVISSTIVDGIVSEVQEDAFLLNTGDRALIVDVSRLPNDPLDQEGYQSIEPGDWVTVSGEINQSFFENRLLVARSVVEIVD